MKMVKFGADQILSGKGGTYTDEDIDALIAKGEERTNAMQAKLKTDAQHNLASFSLLGEDNEVLDTFAFGGENYRDKQQDSGTLINLPQRERKRNYDVNEYFRDAMNQSSAPTKSTENPNKKRKKAVYSDFQLFNKERLDYFHSKEREYATKKEDQMNSITLVREKSKSAPSVHNSRVEIPKGESREELEEMANQMQQNLLNFTLTDGKSFYIQLLNIFYRPFLTQLFR